MKMRSRAKEPFYKPLTLKTAEGGSVLITVIWTLSILAIFTVAINRQASQELLFGQWMRNRILARSLSKAGIERALAQLQTDKFEAFDAFNESWSSEEKAFKDIPLGEGSFSVVCGTRFGACDEASRININTADELTLKNLLMLDKGMDDKKATQIAQSIMDWRDADDAAMPEGAESQHYRAQSRPYEPRNGPFQSMEELLMVRGMDEKIFDFLKPFITVYTDGKVNLNTAPKEVIRAFGMDDDLAKTLVAYRVGPDKKEVTKDDEVFQSADSVTSALSSAVSFSSEEFGQISNVIGREVITIKSDVFRIQSIGRLVKGDRIFESTITCVLTREGGILYWKEGEV